MRSIYFTSLAFVGFLSFPHFVTGQELTDPKNFAGLLGGVEWNTTSGTWGFEFERTVFTHEKFTLAARANYISAYKYGNLQIIGSSGCCETASQVVVMPTVSFFTSKRQSSTGFFLHAGLGAGWRRWRYSSQGVEVKRHTLHPAFDLGPGILFKLNKRLSLRARGAILFGPFEGAFTHLVTSIGF